MTDICTLSRKADRAWDDWIAKVLKGMGYQVDQVYLGMQPGTNGTSVYDRAIRHTKALLYIVSDHPVAVGQDDAYLLYLKSLFGLSAADESDLQPYQLTVLQKAAQTTMFVWPERSEPDDDRLWQFPYQVYLRGQGEEAVVASLTEVLRGMAPTAGLRLPR